MVWYDLVEGEQTGCAGKGAKKGKQMTQEALAYVTEALDYIQAHSVRRASLDWAALRQEVLELAAGAQTPAETYPAIERALELLGDQHSFFRTPEQQRLLKEGKMK